MSDGGNKLLFAENSAVEVRLIEETLQAAGEDHFEILNVSRLEDAVARLEAGGIDIVLLEWRLPEINGLPIIADLTARFSETPMVVLARAEDEDSALQSLKFGVQDYLIKGRIDSDKLSHALKTAVVRHQIVCDELGDLDTVAGTTDPMQAGPERGSSGLKEQEPKVFEELGRQYSDVLELSMEDRAFQEDNHLAVSIKELVEILGRFRATPRDLVDLHGMVLKEKTGGVPLVRVEAVVKEGRWVLLQTMGYLAAYYRHSCLNSVHVNEPGAENRPIE